jgi:hypothetical protein
VFPSKTYFQFSPPYVPHAQSISASFAITIYLARRTSNKVNYGIFSPLPCYFPSKIISSVSYSRQQTELLQDSILYSTVHRTATTTLYAPLPVICYSEIHKLAQNMASVFATMLHVNNAPCYAWDKRHPCLCDENWHFNPLPSLTLQSARDLNVLCRPKRSKALLLSYTFKCQLKKTQSFCPYSRALNRSGKGLKM